jgi:hypothetical protein
MEDLSMRERCVEVRHPNYPGQILIVQASRVGEVLVRYPAALIRVLP